MPSDEADDDVGGHGPPLPPDDRLWRHPSEISALGPATGPTLAAARSAHERNWVAALGAGLAGAVIATSVLMALGSPWASDEPRDVVEKVALSPMVSAPVVRGDRRVADVAARVTPSVARIELGGADHTGSAVAFRDDGHLLTSTSVVDGKRSLTVVVGDDRLEGKLVGVDDHTGVAVVKTNPRRLPPAVLGDPAELEVGMPSVAIGAAHVGRARPTVASGVVSALDRQLERPGRDPLYGMIQLDVPIAEGAAGGPVLDSRGAVVGLAVAGPDGAGRFGFAIPIDVARRVADDIIGTGSARHCWIGIEGSDLTPTGASQLGLLGGAAVKRVLDGGPAAVAGVEAGDVITRFADKRVTSMSELVSALRRYEPGDAVALELRRGTQVVTMRIELGLRPG